MRERERESERERERDVVVPDLYTVEKRKVCREGEFFLTVSNKSYCESGSSCVQ